MLRVPISRKAGHGKMEKVFAIGDVHGCVTELRTLINRLPLTADSTIVFLGDYIDRGPHSKEVIETILELGRSFRVVPLMGNHERMFLQFCAHPRTENAAMFIFNGGSATLASYADEDGQFRIPEEHLSFLRQLPLCHKAAGHFFVHAGVPDVPIEKLDPKTHAHDMLWIRKPFHESGYRWSHRIVHGHTPVKKVDLLERRINLDTGCACSRHLSAIELPEGKIYTTPRGPKPAQPVLRDHSSRRMAIRFEGTVPVYIHSGRKTHAFQASDFSERGMYMRAMTHPNKQVFAKGDIIVGDIGSDLDRRVYFQGRIARVVPADNSFYYGVKMSSLPRGQDF